MNDELKSDPEPGQQIPDIHEDADYITTRRMIRGSHIRVLYTDRLKQALQLTQNRLDLAAHVGVIKARDGGILVCSAVFSSLLGIRTNSLNANLRPHGFERDIKHNTHQALRTLAITASGCYAMTWSHWHRMTEENQLNLRQCSSSGKKSCLKIVNTWAGE
jgi:hypothetical protein